jgi:hypothetical protein
LAGAWAFSLLGRAVSLVPIAVLLLETEAAADESVRLYLTLFAWVASASYVLTYVYEAQRFSARRERTTGSAILAHSALSTVAVLPFIAPLPNLSMGEIVITLVAACLQPLVARLRTLAIDSSRYRPAYASTGVRDTPAALLAVLSLGLGGSVLSVLPLALAGGVVLQLLVLRLVSRHVHIAPPDPDPAPRDATLGAGLVVAASALFLAAFPPVARVLAELSGEPTSLAQFEFAERPAYTIGIAVAGGVGTELQRRWRDRSGMAIRTELRRAQRLITIALLAFGGAIWMAAWLLQSVTTLDFGSSFLVLLPLCILSNGLYLFAVLRTRLLLAVGHPRPTAAAYAAGLLVAVTVWALLGLSTAGPTVVYVPVSTSIGFLVALVSQDAAARKFLR